MHALASLLTVLPVVVAVGSVIAGYASGFVLTGSVLALIVIAITSAYWWRRATGAELELAALKRERDELEKARLVAFGALDGNHPGPSSWLPIEGDLSSLTLTVSSLEDAYERGLARVRREFGEDAFLNFSGVLLLPKVYVSFGGAARLAEKTLTALVDDTDVLVHGIDRSRPRVLDGVGEVWYVPLAPPWRGDDSWLPLVRQSWTRVRPFTGSARLGWGNTGTAEEHGWTHWYVRYVRVTDGVRETEEIYSMRNGELRHIDSVW